MTRRKPKMTETKKIRRFPAIGGPYHDIDFRFDKAVEDIPLIIPYEAHGGVYVYNNDTYVWKAED